MIKRNQRNKKRKSEIGISQFTLSRRQFMKNKGAMFGLIALVLVFIIAIYSGFAFDYKKDICGMNISQRLQTPSWSHPFGTDHMGRDVMKRVCYGAQYSLMIGFIGVAISTIFGVTLGSIAGYYGGRIESYIMRVVELFLMIPGILITILLVSVFGISLENLILAFGLATVPHFARNARAAVMTVCDTEYIEAAKAIGVNDFLIILTHVLPNALSPILVQATTRIGSCIVGAAGFSFMGLGVPLPTPEWGAMLSDAKTYMTEFPHLIIFPGLAIFVLVLAVNLVGDGLRDALDPKLKR